MADMGDGKVDWPWAMCVCMQDGSEASVEWRICIFAHVADTREAGQKTMEIAVATKLLGRSPPNITMITRHRYRSHYVLNAKHYRPVAPRTSQRFMKIDLRCGTSGLSSCDKAARILLQARNEAATSKATPTNEAHIPSGQPALGCVFSRGFGPQALLLLHWSTQRCHFFPLCLERLTVGPSQPITRHTLPFWYLDASKPPCELTCEINDRHAGYALLLGPCIHERAGSRPQSII